MQLSAKYADVKNYAEGQNILHQAQQYFQSILQATEDSPNYNTLCEEYVAVTIKFETYFICRYATFVSQCEQIDTEFVNLLQNSRSALSDQTAQLFMKMKNSTRVAFLSGARKDKIVKTRKVCSFLENIQAKFEKERYIFANANFLL